MRSTSAAFFSIAVISILAGARLAIAGDAGADDGAPKVGAIRWDAWYGGDSPVGKEGPVAKTVETSLAAEKWHYRLPFFAQVLGPDQVHIDGSSQAIMDKEIDYAADAGLKYWAFVSYAQDNPMFYGVRNYLASTHRNRLDFAMITSPMNYQVPERLALIESLVIEKGYLTVLGGRPVVYIGFMSDKESDRWGGDIGNFRKVLDDFRAYCIGKELKNPYLVVMDFHADAGKKWLDTLGADAITSYTTRGNTPMTPGDYEVGAPFAELNKGVRWFWDQCKATGAQVVPIVVTGADRRPRVEHPVFWEKNTIQTDKTKSFAQDPKPEQIAEQMSSALTWLKTNRAAAQSQLVLAYAWNENDEGGWLVPTLGEGTARLDAIAKVIKAQP